MVNEISKIKFVGIDTKIRFFIVFFILSRYNFFSFRQEIVLPKFNVFLLKLKDHFFAVFVSLILYIFIITIP